MQAAVVNQFGEPVQIEERPVPQPAAGQVLVRQRSVHRGPRRPGARPRRVPHAGMNRHRRRLTTWGWVGSFGDGHQSPEQILRRAVRGRRHRQRRVL